MSDIEQRLNAWRETPFEGDPMIDALLTDIPEAADRLRQYREALEAVAHYVNDKDETLSALAKRARTALKETTDVD